MHLKPEKFARLRTRLRVRALWEFAGALICRSTHLPRYYRSRKSGRKKRPW